jgi:hypothetical protein
MNLVCLNASANNVDSNKAENEEHATNALDVHGGFEQGNQDDGMP